MSSIHEQMVLRIKTVFERILSSVQNDPDMADMYMEVLDEMLTDLQSSDAFGTEGQCDPRGDQRNGEFSMNCVEGIDD
jgi:hypothetical protein